MNLKKIEDIIAIFEKSAIKRLVVGDKDLTVTLHKQLHEPKQVAPTAVAVVPPVAVSVSNDVILKAGGVGFFHSKVSLKDIQNQSVVKKGKSIFTITSMNLDHDLHAEHDCIVKEVLVAEGVPVEYGQEVVRVELL